LDPHFIIKGMKTDSSLSVSDFDEDIYKIPIKNYRKANNNNSNTPTISNNNKQVTYNILA